MPSLTKADIAANRRHLKKTRFLVDESVDTEVAEWLRSHHWNAVHVTGVGLAGRDDKEVLAFAQRDNRVLVTHDGDFLDNRKFPQQRNPGIVVLPASETDSVVFGTALGRMARIVGTSRELWRHAKIRVTEDQRWWVSIFERDIGRVVVTRYRFRGNGGLEIWVGVKRERALGLAHDGVDEVIR